MVPNEGTEVRREEGKMEKGEGLVCKVMTFSMGRGREVGALGGRTRGRSKGRGVRRERERVGRVEGSK